MDKAEVLFEKRGLSREFAFKLLSSTKGKVPTGFNTRRAKVLAMRLLAKKQHVPSKTGRRPLIPANFIKSLGILDADARMKRIRVRSSY